MKGIKNHTIIANMNINNGDNIKINIFTWFGMRGSFKKSFTPSARGCNKPYSPTMFGPFLIWVYPRTFLSTSVSIAILINKGKKSIMNFRTLLIIIFYKYI